MRHWFNKHFRNSRALPDLLPGSFLHRFLYDSNIGVLDIGGRGLPTADLMGFKPYSDLITVEADREAAEILASDVSLRQSWRSVTVLPVALGSVPGEGVKLYITDPPGLSSLLSLNHDYWKRYFLRPVSVSHIQTVNVQPLSFIEEKTSNCKVIKLDTQGTELDILQSASQDQLNRVEGVIIEASLLPFYEGQPLFDEVHQMLARNGFRLADLQRTKSRHVTCGHLDYSRKEMLWVNATYVKKFNESVDTKSLAAVAFGLGFYDLALHIIEGNFIPINDSDRKALIAEIREYSTKVFRYRKRFLRFQSRGMNLSRRHHQDKWYDLI